MPSSSGGRQLQLLWLFIAAAAVASPAFAAFSFKEGNRYVYSVDSRTHTEEIGEFIISGQFAIQVQSRDPDGSLHLLLTLTKLVVRNGRDQTTEHSSEVPLDKWFTFQLEPSGRVSHVRYPEDESAFLATIKKGLVTSLLGHDEAYDFHTTHEWTTRNRTVGRYHVEIAKTRRGVAKHNIHRNATHTMHYNHVTRLPEKAFIDDELRVFNSPPAGFDPHGGRDTGSMVDRDHEDATNTINPVTTVARTEFHLTEVAAVEPLDETKIPSKLATESVNQSRLHEVFKSDYQLAEIQRQVDTNLSCIVEVKGDFKSESLDCYRQLVELLSGLSSLDLSSFAAKYLDRPYSKISNDIDRRKYLAMLDAVSSVGSVTADLAINQFILRSSNRQPELIHRALAFLPTKTSAPANALVNTLVQFVFNPDGQPDISDTDTYHRSVLALGTACYMLRTHGDEQQKAMALNIVGKLEKLTGVFDPFHHRTKRSAMNDETFERFSFLKSALIDSLGNAAFESSFEVIQSYSNETTAPSLWKRSGLHAMRKYETVEAASTLLAAALLDEEEHVRYEASLMYQTHPAKTKDIVTMHREFMEGFVNAPHCIQLSQR